MRPINRQTPVPPPEDRESKAELQKPGRLRDTSAAQRIGRKDRLSMDRKIIIIQHSGDEGPGTIEEFFSAQGWPVQIIDASLNGPFPGVLDEIAAVVSLGGPMNVYEEDQFPFLADEDRFVTRLIIEEIPFLGICLGSQILAKACGAKVFGAPVAELGWAPVEITGEGRSDRLFSDLPQHLKVFQWHHDTFGIPDGGRLLATGEACPNQAFKVGANAYGLQFHIEATPEMVRRWVEMERGRLDTDEVMRQTVEGAGVFRRQGNQVLDNFRRIIESSVRIRRVISMFVEDEKARKAKHPIAWWQREELGGLKLLASHG